MNSSIIKQIKTNYVNRSSSISSGLYVVRVSGAGNLLQKKVLLLK